MVPEREATHRLVSPKCCITLWDWSRDWVLQNYRVATGVLLLVLVLQLAMLRDAGLPPQSSEWSPLSNQFDVVGQFNQSQVAAMGVNPTGLSVLKPFLTKSSISPSKIGLLNLDDSAAFAWAQSLHEHKVLRLRYEPLPPGLSWWDFFQNGREVKGCPRMTYPSAWATGVGGLDALIANIPCSRDNSQWNKDLTRHYLSMLAASAAASQPHQSSWNLFHPEASTGDKRVPVLIFSGCPSVPNLFHCSELQYSSGSLSLYLVDVERMRERVDMPFGTCAFAVEYRKEGFVKPRYQKSKKREAYASAIFGDDSYVCGALMVAHTLRVAKSLRDLVLLIGDNLSDEKKRILVEAGWNLHEIQILKYKDANYRDYLLSKIQVWKVAGYDRIVYLDADVMVLSNLDFMFDLPELTAVGDCNQVYFNSGIMTLEPSQCMFEYMLKYTEYGNSYDGADQGFLNDIFTWWHRLPELVNPLKSTYQVADVQHYLNGFKIKPPPMYTIHYVGQKPWNCKSNTSDCNKGYAGDINVNEHAHQMWWQMFETFPDSWKPYCLDKRTIP